MEPSVFSNWAKFMQLAVMYLDYIPIEYPLLTLEDYMRLFDRASFLNHKAPMQVIYYHVLELEALGAVLPFSSSLGGLLSASE